MSVFSGTRSDGLQELNSVLAQQANYIGEDVHREILHTSPWIDLIPKKPFPDGVGYRLQALIYERALPTNAAQDTIGLTWGDFAGPDGFTSGQTHSAQVSGKGGLLNDSVGDYHGPLSNSDLGAAADTGPSRVDWVKRLEPYSLKRATVWSPEINLEDLRFAAHRGEQLNAAFNALVEGVRFGWEERNRDEFQRICQYVVEVRDASTSIFNETNPTGANADDRFDNGVPAGGTTANISNGILDKIYQRLVRTGGGGNPWGMESGSPVFALILSSEASRTLMTESEFRTDVRESSRVDELLAPLNVNKSFRGFYHVIDDLCPRYIASAGGGGYTAGDYERVEPFSINSSTQLITPNSNYDSAKYEVAFVLHKEVMECLIPTPAPTSGPGGMSFSAQDYSGKFSWLNIPSVDLNPLGSIGHFLGVLASATKPLKTRFGWALIFDRTSTAAGK